MTNFYVMVLLNGLSFVSLIMMAIIGFSQQNELDNLKRFVTFNRKVALNDFILVSRRVTSLEQKTFNNSNGKKNNGKRKLAA